MKHKEFSFVLAEEQYLLLKFFKSQNEFQKWLKKYHNKADEIFVGFYKVHTKKDSINYQQALDEALCFGWIDGIRKKY